MDWLDKIVLNNKIIGMLKGAGIKRWNEFYLGCKAEKIRRTKYRSSPYGFE
jgi:hypothetical protein